MIKKPQTANREQPTILLGLTTTPGSDWRAKIKEINELGIGEIALFPTCLDYNERQILYDLLEKTKLKHIPHVHLRDDFELEELNYLNKKFGSSLFNLHPNANGFACLDRLEKYRDKIFVENLTDKSIKEIRNNISKFAGLCIDFAHWEDENLCKNGYENFAQFASTHNIGCCHISAIYQKPRRFNWGEGTRPYYSWHKMEKLENLDYLKKYIKYLPDVISIELENSFKEQLEAKRYIISMLSAAGSQ